MKIQLFKKVSGNFTGRKPGFPDSITIALPAKCCHDSYHDCQPFPGMIPRTLQRVFTDESFLPRSRQFHLKRRQSLLLVPRNKTFTSQSPAKAKHHTYSTSQIYLQATTFSVSSTDIADCPCDSSSEIQTLRS